MNIDVNVICDAPDGNAVSGFIIQGYDEEGTQSGDDDDLSKYAEELVKEDTDDLPEAANIEAKLSKDSFILSAADLADQAAKDDEYSKECPDCQTKGDFNSSQEKNIDETTNDKPGDDNQSKHSSATSIDKKSFDAEIEAVQELQSKPELPSLTVTKVIGTGSIGRGLDIKNLPG